ncbi:MAG: helix-hairpin-helix domain-containing protein [Candidatus Omnitrophota bacterium]
MTKKIADIFDAIADILGFKQDKPFKIRAYRIASQRLRSLENDISTYAKKDALTAMMSLLCSQ